MGSHVDDTGLRSFQQEVRECLPKIRERLAELEQSPESRQALLDAQRLVQTVSNAASMLGLAKVCESANAIDEFLSGAAEAGAPVDAETAASLSGVIDEIESQVPAPEDADQDSDSIAVADDGLDLPPDLDLGFELEPADDLQPESVSAFEPDEPTSGEFLEVFQEEAQEHLASINEALRDLEADPENQEQILELRRAMHTLKGAAGTIGLRSAQRAAHHSEDLLDRIAEGQASFDPQYIPLFYATADVINDIAEAGGADDRALAQVAEITALFGALAHNGAPAEAPPPVFEDLEPAAPELDAAAPRPDQGLAELAAPDDLTAAPEIVDDLEQDDPAGGELLETFQEEAAEHVTLIAGFLRDLERDPGHADLLQELRRSMHTLKGAAGMVGLRSAQRVAHHSEDLLDRTVDSGGALDPEVFPLLFETADVIEDIARAGFADAGARAKVLSLTSRFAVFLKAHEAPLPVAASDAPKITADDVPADSVADAELLEVFQEETEENLTMIDERLAALAGDPSSHPDQKELRRAMHTLKGAGGMVGLHSVHWIAKKGEYLMNDLLERGGALAGDKAKLLAETARVIGEIALNGAATDDHREAIAALAECYETMPQAMAPGKAKAAPAAAPPPAAEAPKPKPAVAAPPAPKPAPKAAPPPAPPKPQPRPAAAETTHGKSSSGQYARVPLERVEELVRLVSELIVSRSAFEQHYRQFAHEGGELRLSAERLKRLSIKLENDYAIKAMSGASGGQALFASAAGASADSFDELEFDRYSEFHLLSRDFTETASDVTTAGGELKNVTGDFQASLARLSRLTSEVQDGLMRLRMAPFSSLENRLHRTVRVAAQATGKNVRLEIEGSDVELDKTVLEEMTGPFEHLLRNAVDHGIESAEERAACGKPEQGSVVVRAYLEGARAMIEISDDGGGLDAEMLRQKAIERGIYSDGQAAELTEEEAYELIFHPGFSTAKTVSQVSGRGVGMDVVRSTIHSLNGSMLIRSKQGQGTTFEIRLPTTLAVARVVMVEANRQIFAAPVHAIRHVLRLLPEQIEDVDGGEVVYYEGRRLRAVRLADALNLPGEPDPDVERPAALIVEAGERSFVILADRLHEASEVVVKSLGVLRKVHGINAATIAGDGSVVLILNPTQLAEKPPQEYTIHGRDVAAEAAAPQLEVLVVDDSLSVRRVVTKVLENAGWKPIQARDGVEALETLQKLGRTPDAVLLDVEMPRMDGYELTAEIRGKDQYNNLPLIMLTSRAGQKHRDRAKELGVNDYLVKPFQEEALLGAIQRAVHAARANK